MEADMAVEMWHRQTSSEWECAVYLRGSPTKNGKAVAHSYLKLSGSGRGHIISRTEGYVMTSGWWHRADACPSQRGGA